MRVHVKVLASAVLSGLCYYGIKSLTINPPPGLPRLNARWRNGPPVAYRTRRACSQFGGDSRVMHHGWRLVAKEHLHEPRITKASMGDCRPDPSPIMTLFRASLRKKCSGGLRFASKRP
jgi:hypothetical protein